jgi:hypothetical protein
MAMVFVASTPHDPAMFKRSVVAVLWFLACWNVWAWVSFLFGVPDAIGPVLGVAAALFFAGDPLGVIWPKAARSAPVTRLDLEHLPDDVAQAA